jgi:signal transduction histidine kinase
LQTGQSTIEVDLTDDILVARTSNNEHFQLRRALGETGYITVPLRARGRILGVISLVVGDSGRRYTLDDLALAEELSYRAALAVDNARLYHEAQASIQAREQFLSIASHELKTPLTALVGYVKLLRQRQPIPQEQTDRNMRALRVISEQADRLNKLITLMLDLSRIQQGQLTIDPAPLDLTALARRVAGDIEWTLDQHTLMVETPSEPVYMIGDAVRLEQALHNLLQNAVKYSPAGGLVQVGVAQHATFACMWVTDQGIGIPAKSRSLLFQRFQRINNPETQHVSGLGLGLYIVKEIVALHNGSIDVTSKEGMGSTFTIRLPLNVLDHAAYAAAEQQQTPYSR